MTEIAQRIRAIVIITSPTAQKSLEFSFGLAVWRDPFSEQPLQLCQTKYKVKMFNSL